MEVGTSILSKFVQCMSPFFGTMPGRSEDVRGSGYTARGRPTVKVTRLTVTGFGAFFLDTRHVDGNRPLLHLFALSRSKSVPTRDSHVAQNPSPLFAELGLGLRSAR